MFGFVKQSGGHVKIYSEPGSGTTVKIYLPRHTAAPLIVPKEPDPISAGSVGETILVVEDEEDVRKFTVDVLSDLGYRVTSAADGQLALKELEKLGGVQLRVELIVKPFTQSSLAAKIRKVLDAAPTSAGPGSNSRS